MNFTGRGEFSAKKGTVWRELDGRWRRILRWNKFSRRNFPLGGGVYFMEAKPDLRALLEKRTEIKLKKNNTESKE